ncbi:hypothetical protein [Anatilimnocola floriformis]|uniref:hypothetical protein n=1 Tax=Anatilimnocola floriformis TaxID=2948575 RepID=UPI0020C584D6|nr:hypothetical protein [Anatilimnocola floriformis]
MSVSAQAPVAPPKQATLWSFLGIPQTYTSVRDNWDNRLGNRPQAERKPNLIRLADPKNLESPNPAIKKAAEIKKEEDLAKQKIKAVKYLTKIGCGCYNRDGSITDALLKALDDCTEDVRYQTVKAITEAANGEACANCKNKSCCSEELSNKLYEMAYERDDAGCFLEPSERVRNAAAEALRACCPGRGPQDGFILDETDGPGTGTGEVIPQGERPEIQNPGTGERPSIPPPQPTPAPELGPVPGPPAPTPARNRGQDPAPRIQDETGAAPVPGQRSSRRTAGVYNGQPKIMQTGATFPAEVAPPELGYDADPAPAPSSTLVEQARQVIAQPARQPATYSKQPMAHSQQQQPVARPAEQLGAAVTASVDVRNNQAMVNFTQGEQIRVGTVLRAYHNYAFTGRQPVGEFVVIQSTPGFAIVRPHGQTRLNKLVSGDQMQLAE